MKCNECGSTDTFHNGIEYVCRKCGLVLEDNLIDQDIFLSESQKEIARSNTSAGTGMISGKIYKNKWFYSHTEKKIESLEEYARTVCSKLNLPYFIHKETLSIIKRVIEKNVHYGRNPQSLICACVYCSCLNHSIVRTHLDFELHTSISRHEILQFYRIIQKNLKLPFKRFDVPDLIEYYATKLNLSGCIIIEAIELWRKHHLKMQRSPAYITASTLLYMACKGKVTQGRIAFCTGAHEVTMKRLLHSL